MAGATLRIGTSPDRAVAAAPTHPCPAGYAAKARKSLARHEPKSVALSREMAGLAAMRAGIAMRNASGHLEMAESGDFILATYRDIAAHFRLGGPNAARTKAKRAGWTPEPTNHPADPLHIRVPRDAWSQAADTVPRERPGTPPIARERDPISRQRAPLSQGPDTLHIRALEGHIATLREDLAGERAGRVAAEQQRDQALVDLRTERQLSAAEAARLAAATDAAVADARNSEPGLTGQSRAGTPSGPAPMRCWTRCRGC